MKKFIVAVAATAVLLVGFSTPAHAVVPSMTKKDKQYVRVIRMESPSLRFVSPRQLVRIAKLNCRGLRAGLTIPDVVMAGVSGGLDEDTVLTLVAGAVIFYCPEQENNF